MISARGLGRRCSGNLSTTGFGFELRYGKIGHLQITNDAQAILPNDVVGGQCRFAAAERSPSV